MNKIIEDRGEMYEELTSRVATDEELINVFHVLNVNSNGRTLAFLVLLYYKKQRDESIGDTICLVANVLRLNFEKSEKKSKWRGLIPYIGFIIVCYL